MKAWRVLLFTLMHFILQLSAFAFAFSIGMEHFDTLDALSTGERVVSAASVALMLPLILTLLSIWPWATGFPREHVPFTLNSLLWGLLLIWTWMRCKAWRSA